MPPTSGASRLWGARIRGGARGLSHGGGVARRRATAIGARERAYRLYRQQGDHEGAARVAIRIADNLLTFSGD